jgi:phosphate acetyltransferase
VLPGPGTIYLGQTLLKPVRIGDELRITATVASKEDEKKHVTLDCEIKNQNGAVVLSGLATVIAPTEKVRRPRTQLPPLYMPSRHQYTACCPAWPACRRYAAPWSTRAMRPRCAVHWKPATKA